MFPRLEQRRYAAHAFRVTEANIAAGRQAVVHRLDRFAPRAVVEIDQHVPAKDHVDVAEPAHELRIDDIALGEIDGTAEILGNPVAAVLERKLPGNVLVLPIVGVVFLIVGISSLVIR